jgi:hypothetical protein
MNCPNAVHASEHQASLTLECRYPPKPLISNPQNAQNAANLSLINTEKNNPECDQNGKSQSNVECKLPKNAPTRIGHARGRMQARNAGDAGKQGKQGGRCIAATVIPTTNKTVCVWRSSSADRSELFP